MLQDALELGTITNMQTVLSIKLFLILQLSIHSNPAIPHTVSYTTIYKTHLCDTGLPYLPQHISYDKSHKIYPAALLENIKGWRPNTRTPDNIKMELNVINEEEQGVNVIGSG
jgi:hypothetical protein